jgi:hypothetical protein
MTGIKEHPVMIPKPATAKARVRTLPRGTAKTWLDLRNTNYLEGSRTRQGALLPRTDSEPCGPVLPGKLIFSSKE